LHFDFRSVPDAHVLRWNRFFFGLGKFRVIVQCSANSKPDTGHGPFAFAHSNANRHRNRDQPS
jgi:hypothetical protein